MPLSSSTLVRNFYSSFTRDLIGRFTLPLVTGVETKSTYKCEECPDEPVTTETETSYQVSCFIAQDVKYMYTAMRKVSNGNDVYWNLRTRDTMAAEILSLVERS